MFGPGKIAMALFFWVHTYNFFYPDTIQIKLSRSRYSIPAGKNLIFDRHSYENRTRAWLLCDDQQQQQSGANSLREFIECEVHRDDGLGHVDKCPVTLLTQRPSSGHIDPGQTRLRLFGEDKVILSWRDPSLPDESPSRWRLNALHFADCSLYEADPRRLRHLRPLTFVVFENWFVAIVYSERKDSKWYTGPDAQNNVVRLWVGFNERLNVDAGPFFWQKQVDRDDRMIVAPLDDKNPKSDYLLIETYRMERRKQTVARVSIVYHDLKILGLRKYVIVDGEYEKLTGEIDPYERVTYSTRNNRIGVCAKIPLSNGHHRIDCNQWDRRGRPILEDEFDVFPYRHYAEMAMLNLPGQQGLLLLTANCEDASCNSGKMHRNFVSRIDHRGIVTTRSHIFPKRECDRRTNRADAQLFQPAGEPGRYCLSEVCYEDYEDDRKVWERRQQQQPQNDTKEFKFYTRCFNEIPEKGRSTTAAQQRRQPNQIEAVMNYLYELISSWFSLV
ncbi:unnamed protein product [Trichogramma brassicae]|uniref:Uncharacterized protein n=1 Tax=Trichogramma brassicae TaxID=86971 RepID=A0A6H5IY85_9HYME|nr:unnamed protein product [Trichogramma brassicae]